MMVTVEFRGMAEWTDMSRALANTPGVEDLDVLGLGGRSARVTLRYADGPERLGAVLARLGYALRAQGNGYVLTSR
jgi:hypothetical protein